MAYCQGDDLDAFCTPTETADTTAAIQAATDVINAYTANLFEPVEDLELTLTANRAGVINLPYTPQTIDSVVDTRTGAVLVEDTDWALDGDRIRLTGLGAPNLLVKGREPWVVGNRRTAGARITVTGTFGPADTPAMVTRMTALLAANMLAQTGEAALNDTGANALGPAGNVSTLAVEGYSVSFRNTSSEGYRATTSDSARASTGFPQVDRNLAPYRKANRGRWS